MKDYKVIPYPDEEKDCKAIRYPDQVKEEVVNGILNGELLLKEAMIKYGILTHITIVKWIKKAQLKKKKNQCKSDL
ncbi:hypothetical protein LZQ00_04045 [Sphingobacterium sp. SRCM116780]|uniref:hypothetical protein n=1 Tax=Sphingobacterium sp. SRCM116780 TaxID=2907623 RepID=UPI001F15FA21|nr:hypothetical protein [Sphingobacterium sp. SRCM116780]UIR56991.1 hypothetical protein LZQ00_04045 [Sphingobacterium sp. SRCM116780]